jgi:hypothetical protein
MMLQVKAEVQTRKIGDDPIALYLGYATQVHSNSEESVRLQKQSRVLRFRAEH